MTDCEKWLKLRFRISAKHPASQILITSTTLSFSTTLSSEFRPFVSRQKDFLKNFLSVDLAGYFKFHYYSLAYFFFGIEA
jgi:hypothetical protein